MNAEQRLREYLDRHGLQLPPPAKPKGVYKPLLVLGNVAYASGHLPVQPSGEPIKGRVGAELDLPAACAAARLAGLGLLATLRDALGTLNRVRRVVKVMGMVACTPAFEQHPAVINGCSELLAEVFGSEAGVGARSAFGVGSLPLGAPVEIEAIFEIG